MPEAALPTSYRAWTWQNSQEPRDLSLRMVERPVLGPRDVLIRNEIIGLNPVDWKVLDGAFAAWKPGHVPGVDGAGIVVEVGSAALSPWLGRRVAYHQNLRRAEGSFADYTAIAARAVMHLPDALDFATAASMPCPALTAWLALEKLPARHGALLISGAGGAVGQYLVQFAAARGFQVTAMCNPRHFGRLRALGAGHCMPGPLLDDEVWHEEEGRFLAVIDAVNEDHARRMVPALKANGHIVCIQGRLRDWPCAPFGQALSMHEVALGALHQFGDDEDWAQLTRAGERILADLASGQLQPEPLVIRDFTALPQLLDGLRHRDFSGKPLIRVNAI